MAKKKGVRIDFISKSNLEGKSFNQLFNLIMKHVKDGGIIVLEESFTTEEKTELIQKSLNYVDNKFPGIEFAGFDAKKSWFWDSLGKIGLKKREGMVIVGRADVMNNLEQNKDKISLLARM